MKQAWIFLPGPLHQSMCSLGTCSETFLNILAFAPWSPLLKPLTVKKSEMWKKPKCTKMSKAVFSRNSELLGILNKGCGLCLCVLPKFLCPPWWWLLGVIRSGGEAFLNRAMPPKRDSADFLTVYHVRSPQGISCPEAGRPYFMLTLPGLRLPVSRTARNEFLLFRSHPVCGSVLRTKTAKYRIVGSKYMFHSSVEDVTTFTG